jgi:hypothetical protein
MSPPSRTRAADAVARARRDLVPLVNAFRRLQGDDGRVVADRPLAPVLLDRIERVAGDTWRALHQDALLEAFRHDARRWRAAGLDQPPDFAATREAYRPGPSGTLGLFLAPVRTTNGPPPDAHRLECHLTRVEEPPECRDLVRAWQPEGPGCTYGRLVTGSEGYLRGNCVVCFSELIAASGRQHVQTFALFLLNKFAPIFLRRTLPQAVRLFGPADALFGRARWLTADLPPATYYAARCCWAAAHELFHQAGPRPLRDHLKLKMNWFVGLLEELKVDAQVVLATRAGRLPFGDAIAEFVLLERLLRYPLHPQATRNFDAGTGVLLFEWLADRGAIARPAPGRLTMSLPAAQAALEDLVLQVTGLERQADQAYRAGAEALVRSLLPPGASGERFSFPPRFIAWARPRPETRLLSFARLAY